MVTAGGAASVYYEHHVSPSEEELQLRNAPDEPKPENESAVQPPGPAVYVFKPSVATASD